MALISLLADDDPAIYRMVRRKLLSYGSDAATWLRPSTLSDDPILRRRAGEIIRYLARQRSDEQMLAFCLKQGEELDLEEATGLLSRTEYPEVNVEGYRALYDSWAEDLRNRTNLASEPEPVIGTINRYLFIELGFRGKEPYSYDPANCYLNRVVDRRAGNPISLCAIYLFLARRLRLPISGIGLPGYFIVRYQSPKREIYIDAFRQGKFWTKADCIKHLLNGNHGLQKAHLAPVSSRQIFLRMCANLHQTYAHLEMPENAARVQRYMVALSK